MPRVHRLAAGVFITSATIAGTASGQYASENIELLAELPLSAFGSQHANGNDCWGYVSASGREYAIMGLSHAAAFVEITDPANPVIVAQIDHPGSLWGDYKVYGDYCYAVNENGGGIQVIDLADIDNGTVTLVTSIRDNGISSVHNIAVNEESGFLYTCGASSDRGIIALDLANPARPVAVGWFFGIYNHDAQVVTMKSGRWAGREIAFCCAGPSGLVIVDVTDKANMREIGRSGYPGLDYCHQGWLSQDQRFFYVNDEGDELHGHTPTTRTLVFDVTDLRSPTLVTTFTTGLPATDHNLYVHDAFIYEANYRSGLRLFDAADPLNPVEVGFFDTYPSNDRAGYNGAWSVYPYFPSGTVIISDIERGHFVVDVSDALAQRRLFFDTPDLTAGSNASLTVSNATADATVSFAYSLSGPGAVYAPGVNAMVLLEAPRLGGAAIADSTGVATLDLTVPFGTAGLTVWMQAVEDGRISNVIETTIN
ncbi:MAG: choice-of-anchor B family protein [Phycisphaerales bacterium]